MLAVVLMPRQCLIFLIAVGTKIIRPYRIIAFASTDSPNFLISQFLIFLPVLAQKRWLSGCSQATGQFLQIVNFTAQLFSFCPFRFWQRQFLIS